MSSLSLKFDIQAKSATSTRRYILYPSYFVLFTFCIFNTTLTAQEIYLHSHNDYEQEIPLHTAIDLGFNSLEIDIVISKNLIVVSHDTKNLDTKPTLQKAYLDPLQKLFTHDSFEYDLPLILLIDIKEYNEQILPLLHETLAHYDSLLMNIHSLDQRSLQVILSGDIPRKTIINDKRFKYFFIDGRLTDLHHNYSSFIMPWISHDFSKLTKWNGDNNLSLKDEIKIKNTIYAIQQQNKKVRFWKTAEHENVWKFLYRKNVDIISTDELKKLKQFIYSL